MNRENAFTPGPWAWFGSDYGFYLATTHSGRRYIMDFVRMGMNRAQPRFQVGGLMHAASDLVTFAVGDRGVRGLKAAKSDPSVYRYDIDGIDHPDARLIAAAPEMFEAGAPLGDLVEHFTGPDDALISVRARELRALRAALAKATAPQTQGAE